MGKKKKLAKENINILKSGKIKISKGQKINLRPFVNESINNAVVSRLDGIISKQDVVIDTADLRVDVNTQMTTDMKVAEIVSRVSNASHHTIVITVNKKDALESFNFLNEGTLGTILRTSTLASIYSSEEVKEKWVSLNKDDNTSFTNVLFIPKILVFLNDDLGKVLALPYYINLLVIAVPSAKKMSTEGEEMELQDSVSRVIADISDSAIKCGAKDLIIDPYNYKLFNKDQHLTADLWNQISTSQKFIENFHSITFAINDEESFIIFNASRTKK